ncbi:MAG: tetratricopeptide repeat protein, partial [Planctomycetota bacterium]|nr:tetratricopeptide repeat protein [Planctomycetota bacterium]
MPFDLFISYSRRDNAAGRVTEFVERIAADYRAFAGEELQYFFDTKEIQGAEDWRHRILEGLKQSKLFLLILSPNYLTSDYCQWEIIEYLKYEAARAVQGQGVTPIYFVEIPGLDGPEFQREANDWLMQVRRRNDWDLRPWFNEGSDALKRADVRARLEDLEDSLHVRLSRLRRMASAPGNLPAHNPHFVGRETEMLRLHEAAGLGRCGILTAVHGVGGLGKTALAIQYAYAYADFYPGGRWLISCANRDSLAGALRSLDSDLGVDFTDEEKRDDNRAAKRILRELEERSHRGAAARAQEKRPPQPQALVILDNVDSPHLLQPPQTDLISGRPWLHVLATTRMGPERFGHDPDRHLLLAIDELPPEDALRLIESHQPQGRFADDAERAAAMEILKLLGGYTLVVEVVAVHLAERAGTLTCAAMLERLKRQGLGELETLAGSTNRAVGHVEKLLSVTLAPTLQGLTEPERLVLMLAALLPPDQVAIPWLRVVAAEQYPELGTDAPAGWDDPWLSLVNHLAGMRLLQVVSLAEDNLTARVCRMHRMVQAVVPQQTGCDSTVLWSNLLAHAKSRCEFLEKGWLDWANRWELTPLVALAHLALDRSANEGAWLANEVGVRLYNLARYPEAEPLYRRAWEAREGVLGPEHPSTLTTVNNLAELLRSKGDYAGAEPLHRLALEAQEQVLGPEHPQTLKSVCNLAELLRSKGDCASAEPLLRRALEGYERILGPEHPDTLTSVNNLGELLRSKGDCASAEPLLRRALEGYERILGPEHPSALTTVDN